LDSLKARAKSVSRGLSVFGIAPREIFTEIGKKSLTFSANPKKTA
jgi:hypothetical protein